MEELRWVNLVWLKLLRSVFGLCGQMISDMVWNIFLAKYCYGLIVKVDATTDECRAYHWHTVDKTWLRLLVDNLMCWWVICIAVKFWWESIMSVWLWKVEKSTGSQYYDLVAKGQDEFKVWQCWYDW